MKCFIQRNADRSPAGKRCERGIGDKARVGAEYAITFTHQRLHDNMQRLTCAGRNKDLIGSIGHLVFFPEFGAYRIPEFGNPRVRGIAGLSCPDCGDGCVFDVLRGVKIRLVRARGLSSRDLPLQRSFVSRKISSPFTRDENCSVTFSLHSRYYSIFACRSLSADSSVLVISMSREITASEKIIEVVSKSVPSGAKDL